MRAQLLAAAIGLLVCHAARADTPDYYAPRARLDADTALLLDAALTFLVFADAQSRYGQFSTSSAFFERASAYGLAAIAALAWRYAARRARAAKTNDKPLVIRTSPYSESHLPM